MLQMTYDGWADEVLPHEFAGVPPYDRFLLIHRILCGVCRVQGTLSEATIMNFFYRFEALNEELNLNDAFIF